MQKQSKNKFTKYKTAEPILKRSAVFLCGFIIASGIIGPKIISHDLVNRDGFQVYGSAGKALLFGALAFLILIWRNQPFPKLEVWKKINIIWLLAFVISIIIELHILNTIIGKHSSNIELDIFAHLFIIVSVLSSLLFSFSIKNIRTLIQEYQRELLMTLTMSILFIIFVNLIYDLWNPLANLVLNCVRYLLNTVNVRAIYLPPHTLSLSKFTINLIQACSGVDSIALFTALYILFGILDWKRFNHKKYLGVFIPALIVLTGFNILRVFALILGGYYINPQIAFSLFHTYAGMIFFILYSSIFWVVCYKWMLDLDA